VSNRRISEFSPINGTEIIEQDLLTLVHVLEADPALRNKKITFTELKNYLNQYYLTGSGGVFSDNVLINGSLTVTGNSNFTSVTGLNLATFSGVVVQNNLTAAGTISGITFTGTSTNTTTTTAITGTITSLTGTTTNYTTGNFQTINVGTHIVSGNTTVAGTLGVSGAVTLASSATISGTLSGTTITGTTARFAAGTFTSLTGTTFTGITANLTSGNFQNLSGNTITGNTISAISGVFQNLFAVNQTFGGNLTFSGDTAVLGNSTIASGLTVTGTISGTTITGTTVLSTTGSFTSLTGTTTTGVTVQFTTGTFTSLTGTTTSGTTARFATGVFTSLTGTTTSGTTAGFTTGTFTSLTGTTTTGVTATYTTGSFTSLTGITTTGTTAAFTSGNFQTVSGITVIGSTTVSGATVTGTTANFTSGNFSNLISAAATMSGALVMANQQQVRFQEAVGNGVNHIALQAPGIVSSDRTITLPDQTGTLVTTGDNGSVTSTMILDGTILNIDVNTSAGIEFSKLANISTTDRLLGRSTASAGPIEEVVCTAAGRALLADVSNTAQRTTLGLGTIATLDAPTGSVVGTTDTQTLASKTFTDPIIIGTILEDVFTITDGAAFEVDPGNGSIQLVTLGSSRTPKATNFAAGESITLMVADGTAYAITWTDATWGTGGVKWTGGTAPALATTGFTVLQFWKVGTQIYGAYVGDVA
jgi:hypothetical protein